MRGLNIQRILNLRGAQEVGLAHCNHKDGPDHYTVGSALTIINRAFHGNPRELRQVEAERKKTREEARCQPVTD